VTLKQFGTDAADQRRNGESKGASTESVTGELARVIAHDLPQPLNTIIGFSDLLDRRYRGEIDEDADEFMGFIVTGARRMQAMLADLRMFLGVGDSPPPAAPVDCSKVVQAAVDSLATKIDETGATVTIGPLPHVQGDSAQFGQLFRQLLSNALKFRSEHAPRISISATHENGHAQFVVADNGRGIETSWSDRAFELFETLHGASEEDPGTGAGLATCRRIVERHGGEIWFEPGLESGSRFHFTIPDRVQG
jgi:light-regulated signal transduction histidine kinase (bacteriophytochrome)